MKSPSFKCKKNITGVNASRNEISRKLTFHHSSGFILHIVEYFSTVLRGDNNENPAVHKRCHHVMSGSVFGKSRFQSTFYAQITIKAKSHQYSYTISATLSGYHPPIMDYTLS